jgi:hypothetical protein
MSVRRCERVERLDTPHSYSSLPRDETPQNRESTVGELSTSESKLTFLKKGDKVECAGVVLSLEDKHAELAMPTCYLESMDLLVKDGLYENHAEIVKDALRRLFKHYDIKLLKPEAFPEPK